MRRQASPVPEILVFATKILVTGLKIFPYEHSSPVTGIKLERSCLVYLSNRAEISHMNRNQAEILPGQAGWNFPCEQMTKFVPLTGPARLSGSYEEPEEALTISLACQRSTKKMFEIITLVYKHQLVLLQNQRVHIAFQSA